MAVPRWMMWPLSMTAISSPSRAASLKSWVTTSVGMSLSDSIPLIVRPALARVRASSAESGSSSSSTRGSRASVRASATRWLSPPE